MYGSTQNTLDMRTSCSSLERTKCGVHPGSGSLLFQRAACSSAIPRVAVSCGAVDVYLLCFAARAAARVHRSVAGKDHSRTNQQSPLLFTHLAFYPDVLLSQQDVRFLHVALQLAG